MRILKTCAATVASTALALVGFAVAPVAAEAGSTCKTEDGVSRCVYFDGPVLRKYKARFEDGATNPNAKGNVKLTCTNNVTKSTKFGVSVAVSGEFKALIFAKMDVTVTGSLEHSVTTSYGSQVEVTIPPKHRARCKYGTYYYRVKGHSTTTVKGERIRTDTWVAEAPKNNDWVVTVSKL